MRMEAKGWNDSRRIERQGMRPAMGKRGRKKKEFSPIDSSRNQHCPHLAFSLVMPILDFWSL